MDKSCTTDPVTHATTCTTLPMGCSIDQQTGHVVCVNLPSGCSLDQTGQILCVDPATTQPERCSFSVVYDPVNPSNVVAGGLTPGCNGADIGLVAALLVARILAH